MSDETDLKSEARHEILKRIAVLAKSSNSSDIHDLAEAYASVVSPSRSAVSVAANAH